MRLLYNLTFSNTLLMVEVQDQSTLTPAGETNSGPVLFET